MPVWTLAAKDLRLLLRDTRAVVILLAMPLIFILVLGVTLGEGFGEKPDDRLRISIVDLDTGLPDYPGGFPGRPWSRVVIDDLAGTAGVRVQPLPDRATADKLVRRGSRPAVLVLGPNFSREVQRCSFLSDPFLHGQAPGNNPFFRDGVDLARLDAEVIEDPTQGLSVAVIKQVAQVSLLRVVLPWMIGKAFDKISEQEFIDELSGRVEVTVGRNPLTGRPTKFKPLMALNRDQKAEVGVGVKSSLKQMFSNYDLTAKTWDALTKSRQERSTPRMALEDYRDTAGSGLLDRGALRYQILVPAYTVMFAFFLVLTVGWLFVAERRQGTLLRLRVAPLTRGQILLGKMVPCLLLSLGQGFLLLLAGRLVFGMSWGTEPLWLLPVVACTSLAAMGLALLVASVARTETQVAVYGTLLVLVLAGLSGCLMPRDLMPEAAQRFSLVTPHAWALDAYKQVLTNPQPEAGIIALACAVLAAFGVTFVGLAWWRLRLE